MCFSNDNCDWSAAVSEIEHVRPDSAAACWECGRRILRGEWRMSIHQQEHEACQLCQDSWSDDFRGDPELWDSTEDEDFSAFMRECKHDYGESFDASICRECCLLLEAIYDLERIEGCPEDSRQPMYGELCEAISEDRDGRYRTHALAMFPELSAHKLLLT